MHVNAGTSMMHSHSTILLPGHVVASPWLLYSDDTPSPLPLHAFTRLDATSHIGRRSPAAVNDSVETHSALTS